MSERRDAGFTEAYELNSFREHVSAYVLVAGLVFELVNACIWYEGVKTLAEMFAVSLIVLGVWGEIFFGNQARIAADGQLEEYRARTAEAEQKAQEAALELAKFREPRTFTRDQMYRIAEKLKPYAGMQFAGATTGRDPEYRDFLQFIERVLMLANWQEIDWHVSPSVTRAAGRTAIGTNVSVSNVLITFPLSASGSSLEDGAIKLAEALTEEGFAAQAGIDHGDRSMIIHVMIGPKR